MKVCFVIDSLIPGGAERSLSELLTRIRREGVKGFIACLGDPKERMGQAAISIDIDVRVLHGSGWVGRAHEVRKLIDVEHPDLVHTSLFQADVVGRLAAAGSGVPVLTSLVNTSYEPVRLQDPNVRRWRLRAVREIDGWTARHLTTHFHAVTHAVKAAAVRDLRIDPDQVTVVERGRDPRRWAPVTAHGRALARNKLGLTDGQTVLVTVGRQEFQKGQWHLVQAMPRIVESRPDAVLLVAGRRGNASDRLKGAVASMSLDGHVRVLGHRDDIQDILAAGDLFVFPSLYEGIGGAVIEAMALGLPIVASDLPGLREVVEEGGNALLVPPSSPQDLVRAIETVLADRSRRQAMGARSRAIFEERFTLERSAKRMLQLFERVAAGGRRP